MTFAVYLEGEAEERFLALDRSLRERIARRTRRTEDETPGRHLRRGLQFLVEEIGQYRIVYKSHQNSKVIYFIGPHKEYEKWFRSAATR